MTVIEWVLIVGFIALVLLACGLYVTANSMLDSLKKDLSELEVSIKGSTWSNPGLEHKVEKLRSDTRLDHMIEALIPQLESIYKEDIELVNKADYLAAKGHTLSRDLGVTFYASALTYGNTKHIPLIKVIERAKELRQLQAKLCCSKSKKGSKSE